jgi:hypothetical protein
VRRVAILLVVSLALVAGGCGSGSKTYSLAKTRECLEGKGVRIGGSPDFVAETATGGAFVANFPGNYVTISFGDTVDDAVGTEKGYERAAFANVREGLADVLKREQNAVLLWHEHPVTSDVTTVQNCLE